MSGWDDAPVGASSGWDDVGASRGDSEWASDSKPAATKGFHEPNGTDSFDEGVKLDDGVDGTAGGDDFKCYNCGEAGHRSSECTEERKMGECYNCGQVGHNKADCTNERVERAFTGTCRLCEQEGHRAADCPTKPPDICRNCNKEGHKAAACDAARTIDRTGIPDLTEKEAMSLLKKASEDRDTETFKKGVQALVKGDAALTYVDIEQKLRAAGLKLYLIALEKEVPKNLVNVNMQGVGDQKFTIGYFLSAKPKRVLYAQGWPENPEENLEKLKEAGDPMTQIKPICRNCDELGHISKSCPQDKVERVVQAIECTICGEAHMTRNCTGERPDRSGSAKDVECRRCHETGHISKDCPNAGDDSCRNCGGEGHRAKDCTEERNMSTVTCRNCNQVGHMSKECTEARDMSTMVCRNCDETGHGSRECPKPRDYSRVECQNCHQKGHTKVRCKEPIADDGGADGFDAPADFSAGGNAGGSGGIDAGSSGWETASKTAGESAGWAAASPEVSAW